MKRILHSIKSAAGELFRRWGTLLLLLGLYFAMLGATYWFFVTREATIGQLILSFVLALAAPILFLVIQTMAARYNQANSGAWTLFGASLRDFWKLLVISVPIILVVVLAVYLFGKIESPTPADTVREPARAVTAPAPDTATPTPPRTVKPKPVSWSSVAITTIQYLLYCLILPLAAIHLWIGAAREGLKQTIKGSHRILARAFSPRSVVIYIIGFLCFAVAPYFLIVTRTPLSSVWLDAGLLVGRLLLAALLSLIGWVVTVGALGDRSDPSGAISLAERNEGSGHVPAEA